MQNRLSQLTLGVSLKDDATFDNFYVGLNEEIISGIKKMARGQGEHMIYLCAARGQGRSHLLQAACYAAHQHQLSSVYIPFENGQSLSPALLNGLESLSLVCMDDVQYIAGCLEWEEAIFHLYNRMAEAGGRMMMAANALPKSLPFVLPDLVSRLTWGVIYQLHSLSDVEKIIVLKMRAQRRGIDLSEEVGRYILTHCPRHMGTLFAALDVLDKASLAAQRRLTIPFVKDVLEL